MALQLLTTTSTELSNLGVVWQQFVQWMGTVTSTITDHPILMVGLGIFAVGATIGLAQRLIRG